MTDLCPSCREPLHYPSGDGCAAMTLHKTVQEQCTTMVYSAATGGFWAAVRGRMKQ
jgi:LSD1 subclass zinc finger protein